MRTIKIISLLFVFLLGGKLFAQSVDDGKKFLYYERYNSARDVFTKLTTANPNNIDAVYWLGQTYIGMADTTSAESLYQKALQANPNSPLLLAGMGEIALLRNNTNDARNRFETAISLSKGKDYNVLNAIGRANVDAKAGDVAYAIEKLKLIPENKRTAEMWFTLGDAYRKMTDGANAQLSYQSALTVDPNYAAASFMIGRIYQTQGRGQESYYLRYYNEAMTKDPNYAPVYGWLYEYYYKYDVNKSREYLDKYIAVSDPDAKNCYYQASLLYVSSKPQEAITKANQCISAEQTPYAKIYGVMAYAYDKLNDSVNSRKYFEMYFQKVPQDQIGPNDYATYARTLLKFPGNEELAGTYVEKAVALDTLETNKVDYYKQIAATYLAQKDYTHAGYWYTKVLSVKKDPGKVDLYNAGYNYYKGRNYPSADSAFALYAQKYPDDILGWYMRGIINATIDSTGAQALAKPYYDKVIELGEASTDTARVKAQLIVAYRYNVAYYYTNKNDIPTALTYVEKTLKIDPTNAAALENQKALMDALNRKTKQKGDVTKTKTETEKEKTTPTKTKVKPK